MTSEEVLAVDNLHVAWETNLILHGISFTVPRGQVVAITGANGSGKSTLLRAILGTAPIGRGSVRIFGHELTPHKKPPWEKIGYVPQRVKDTGGVTASCLEVVRSGLLTSRHWWWTRKDRERALKALKLVGLAHRANDPVDVLSGGQHQRVLIARALVREPAVLIMDEPMAGVDAPSRQRLADIVSQLKGMDTTIVIVLHELGELAPTLDREIHISSGHLAFDKEFTTP